MHRTQIYLPTSQLKLLQKTAQTKETTVSEVLRTLIKNHFVQSKPAQAKPGVDLIALAKRVNAIPGKPGPKDLASKVDDYYYGRI